MVVVLGSQLSSGADGLGVGDQHHGEGPREKPDDVGHLDAGQCQLGQRSQHLAHNVDAPLLEPHGGYQDDSVDECDESRRDAADNPLECEHENEAGDADKQRPRVRVIEVCDEFPHPLEEGATLGLDSQELRRLPHSDDQR